VLASYKRAGGSVQYLSGCLSNRSGGYVWRPPAKPAVTAAMVRARAVRMIPPAALGLAPKRSTLVNIETVMWVEAPDAQTLPTVRILGQQVAIRLSFAHVYYDFGDGQHADGPAGKRYDEQAAPCRTRLCPDYYGHVYTHTGRVTVRATAYWAATFTVDGGHTQQIPGTVPGPQATATLEVKQARSVLTANPNS